MSQYTTQVQLIAALKTQLATNQKQATKALLFLYDRQTTDEKATESTRHPNSIGFNHNDAKFLSSLARQYKETGWLSPSQMMHLMRIVPKYAGQLVKHSLATGKVRKEKGFYVW